MNTEIIRKECAASELARRRTALLVAPPGTGKTKITLNALRILRWPRTLVITHRRLIRQSWLDWAGRMNAKNIEVKMASEVVDDSADVVVIDEAHHLEGKKLQDKIRSLRYQKIYGLSATPSRWSLIPTPFLETTFDYELIIFSTVKGYAIIIPASDPLKMAVRVTKTFLTTTKAILVLTHLKKEAKEIAKQTGIRLWEAKKTGPRKVPAAATAALAGEGVHIPHLQVLVLATKVESFRPFLQFIGRSMNKKALGVIICNPLKAGTFEKLGMMSGIVTDVKYGITSPREEILKATFIDRMNRITKTL